MLNPVKIGSLLAALGIGTTGVVVGVQATSTTSGGSVRLADVPRQYAAPNSAQKALVRLGLEVGPQSSTVYVWGGTSTRGFDCSGFTQYVYRHAINVSIPRTSQAQWYASTGIKVPRQNERAGDLVIFSNSSTYAGHVGLYIGNGKYVEYYHRGARARISYLSEFSRGYLGAHRWYKPARVPVHLLAYVDRLAAKYHVRIIRSFTQKSWQRWAIDFVPHSKPMFRWAKAQHLKVIQLPHRTRLFLRPNPK